VAYTTLARVLSRMGRNGELTAKTVPSLVEAEAIHDGVSAEIDAAMAGAGFTVPITEPPALVSWLAAIESWGTTAELLKVRFQDASGPGSEASWAFFERRYQDAMKRLWAGDMLDEVAGASVAPASWYTRNPDGEEDLGDGVDPAITVGMEL